MSSTPPIKPDRHHFNDPVYGWDDFDKVKANLEWNITQTQPGSYSYPGFAALTKEKQTEVYAYIDRLKMQLSHMETLYAQQMQAYNDYINSPSGKKSSVHLILLGVTLAVILWFLLRK